MSTRPFAELLSEFMEHARLNDAELARRIDISRHTLRRWRTGEIIRPSCDKVLACLPHLGLNTAQRRQFLRAAGCGPDNAGDLGGLDEADLSPFVVGQPIVHPGQFRGRREIVAQIVQVWRRLPLQNIAVTGPRRRGKSSLLHYLRNSLPRLLGPQYRSVLVDFKEARMRHQDSLLHYLLQSLELPALSQCSLVHFEELLSYHGLARPTLILLDDIEYGLASESLPQEFWWGLRSVQHNYCQGKLGFLLAARGEPAQLAQDQGKSSPFFNVFGYQVSLPLFNGEEAREVITHSPLAFAEPDILRIMAEAHGEPEELQRLCAAHLRELEQQQGEFDE